MTNKTIEYIPFRSIVKSEGISGVEILLRNPPRQAVLGNSEICTFSPRGYAVLDFGEEVCGGIEVTVQTLSNSSSRIRVTFGESLMEAMSSIGEKNATNDHSARDLIVAVSPYSNVRIGQTGFRFVRVEAVDSEIAFAGMRVVSELYNVRYKGSFESSDELLNQIWHVGARTVHLCMQDYLWDGIKRDRLVWIGDMHAEVSAIAAVFGYDPIVDNSLDLIKNYTPHFQWMNGIPSYSFWWLIIVRDWYMHTGDSSFIFKEKDYILSLISFVVNSIKSDGTDTFVCNLSNPEYVNDYQKYFIDWETYGTPESKSGFYAVLVMALKAASQIAIVLKASAVSAECESMVRFIRKMPLPNSENKQIAALMSLAELRDAQVVNDTVLSREPVADISAYLGYYTLLAKAKSGDVAGGIDIVKKYWGRMLELGATSFWESFDYVGSFDAIGIDQIVPNHKKGIHGDYGNYCYKGFRCSLCHGWACGPTPFLSNHVLGITPLEAGFKKVLVRPSLGNLDYVQGSYPTPYGNIEVRAKNVNGKLQTTIQAPSGIEIIE